MAHIFDRNGREFDANYTVEIVNEKVQVIFESRSGAKTNPDYAPALEIVFERLASIDGVIVDALVESRNTIRKGFTAEECRINPDGYSYPIQLNAISTAGEFRLAFTSAHANAGVPVGTPKRGAGAWKRFRMTVLAFAFDGWNADQVTEFLSHGVGIDHEPQVLKEEYVEAVELDMADTDRVVEQRVRKEQRYLRAKLFGKASKSDCALCGESYSVKFLIAAHIKKRSECTHEERLDVENIVMPACVVGCDAVYERALCGVADGGSIEVKPIIGGDRLKELMSHLSGRACSAYREGTQPYFAWHYSEKFRGGAA